VILGVIFILTLLKKIQLLKKIISSNDRASASLSHYVDRRVPSVLVP
jgi:hypothetical protein